MHQAGDKITRIRGHRRKKLLFAYAGTCQCDIEWQLNLNARVSTTNLPQYTVDAPDEFQNIPDNSKPHCHIVSTLIHVAEDRDSNVAAGEVAKEVATHEAMT